ncbi:MAG: hypothetical protein JNJ49_09705 [Bdellovibrionaceae bacterium]|nr:hypothetical protein [Pseudobdellovibrionaceae bacterium]
MKLRSSWFISSTLLALLLVVFTWRYSKQLSVPLPLVKSQLGFAYGDLLATAHAPALKGCELAPPLLQAFCYEGYGRHLFMSTKAPLRERISAFVTAFPLGPAISAFNSLGTGLYFVRLPPREMVDLLNETLGPNDIRIDYAVNGWGFAKTRAEKLPPQAALAICDDFVDLRLRDNCQFGAGRASYFVSQDVARVVESPEVQRESWFLRGYGFAATFAGQVDLGQGLAFSEQVRQQLLDGAKLAQARRLIYINTDDGPVEANIDAEVLRITSCLRLYKKSLRCLEP